MNKSLRPAPGNRDPYQALANAIILQAARDWREAVRRLKRRPDIEGAEQMKQETERFFRSEWFHYLSDADGEYILMKLKEEDE